MKTTKLEIGRDPKSRAAIQRVTESVKRQREELERGRMMAQILIRERGIRKAKEYFRKKR